MSDREDIMKRSEINAIIREADDFIRAHGFHLPPFAHWTPDEWKTKGPEVREIVDRKLGWDVTDFNLGEYRQTGLLLFTIRNGNVKDPESKQYAEKIMMVDVDQITPMHFHWHKAEDIINRGGGQLVIQLYNSTPDEGLADTDVTISTDGVQRTVKAGDCVVLNPGESITLPAYLLSQVLGRAGQSARRRSLRRQRRRHRQSLPRSAAALFDRSKKTSRPIYLLCTDYPDYYQA